MTPATFSLLRRYAFICCFASISFAAHAPQHRFAFLKELNLDQPFCQGTTSIEVASQYFVEIANELPGQNEYNQLIRDYRKKEWTKLELDIASFRKLYETSPLMEAVAFLEVQALFDQVEVGNVKVDAVEKAMREVLLLYPKSTLVPVITAGAASFWLKTGLATKALAMYELLRKEHPFHELNCAFQFGAAEANFQAGDRDAAKRGFRALLQKCDNPRMKIGAEMRAADMTLEEKTKEAQKVYEKLYAKQGIIVERYYPTMLYNMGELKYRERQYSSSRFYFKEFLRHKGRYDDCQAYAMKRLADISLFSNKNIPEAVGNYFAVREGFPRNEVSTFSYLHGLLLELKTVDVAEQERRLKIFDMEVEKIKNEKLRGLAFLEKGLAMLEAGEKSALDYLVRLNERTGFSLEKGDIAHFVRENLLAILEEHSEEVKAKPLRKEAEKDTQMFAPIEAAYPVWLKGTSYESRTHTFYSQTILKRYEEALKKNNLSGGLEKLARWKKSSLWSEKDPEKALRIRVGNSLARYLSALTPEKQANAAELLVKHKELMSPFLNPEYSVLEASALRLANDVDGLKAYVSKESAGRAPTSLDGKIPGDIQSYLWYERGLNLWAAQKLGAADLAFQKVNGETYAMKAIQGRIRLYLEEQKYSELIELGLSVVPRFSEEHQPVYALMILEAAKRGKIWKRSSALLSMAKKLDLPDKELSFFFDFSGRSNAETNHCSQAILDYKTAFRLSEESPNRVESKFRLGKCLYKERNTEEARKLWNEVIESKDEFWGPLAQNEMKILEVK